MKRILIFLFIFGASVIFCQKSYTASNSNFYNSGVQIGFFYSSLSPHGEWIEVEPGFHVWRPMHLQRYWRPYLIGQWAWTDYGWYWMSNEPFGWITYHYGRWYNDDYYGWVWIPDDVWGPAWVEWRYDNDYIGWAPLPPYATFNISFGIRFTTHWVAPVHYWNFVRYNRFAAVIHYRDVVSVKHTRRLIRTTRTGSQYEVDHDRIINRGVDRTIIERRGNLRFSRTEVRDVHEQAGEHAVRSGSGGHMERIDIYRPTKDEMQHSRRQIEARRGDRNLTIDMKKIERPRVESRTPSDERSLREERPRENTPRLQEQKSQQNRKEMRHELIQRHERKQNPLPPTTPGPSIKRTERNRESSPSRQSDRSEPEKRSSLGSSRR